VQRRFGNYDHIAIARAGVLLLETKNLKGSVEIRDGVPHLHRRLDPDVDERLVPIRPRVLRAAAELGGEIERRTGRRPWVQAVVVLWSDFPQGYVEHDRCIFIHGPRLRAWIADRADQLDEATVSEITEAVEAIAAEPLTRSARSA
jgi:hypothetical protein